VAEPAFNWRPTVKRRLLVAAGVFLVWTTAIEARLIYLQVISHAELTARAERQQQRTIASPAKRGEISDRHGRLLAYSVDADTIYAVPYEVQDTEATAAKICAALEGCTRHDMAGLIDRLSRQRPFSYIKRRVTPLEARRVAALDLKGVGFMRESRRFYPNRELASHLLGYVGLDNVGLSGLEASYDKTIRGREGTLLITTDAKRQAFSRLERTPTVGASLELTIDEQLQYIVERELRAGIEAKRADGGSAVVMDPHTGEVLAIASWPTFNPNVYNAATEVARRNRAVQDIYEPGSTFKVVTVAAALEENVMPVDSYIDTNPGVIRFGSSVVDEYGGKNYGVLSFTEVIVKSSNVGAIKIGLKIGAERMGLYMNRFGFGRPTSSDFPSESPGIVWSPEKLNDRALASVSMGYQVAVTPLQMAAAMSAVANGGTWIEPRVVRTVIRDGVRTAIAPKVTRRAISAETAAELLPILEAVVEDGTGKLAKIPGFTVAGKTGTADKIINGRYSGSQQNVSFVGFAPSRSPAITVIVMVDTPRVGSDTGGQVAAPIFQRIAEASLRHLGIAPTVNPAPPIVIARHEPSPVTQTAASSAIPTIVTVTSDSHEAMVVPDLRGKSAREALQTLARLGLSGRLQGKGFVIEQMPAAGEPIERGVTCTLVLDRGVPRASALPGAQP
jgi:cell division protein FtsI (penicillin-binding protein 3)